MINTIRWYGGFWLMVLGRMICDVVEAIDPGTRNSLFWAAIQLGLFIFGIGPGMLMNALGRWIVGPGNQPRLNSYLYSYNRGRDI